MPSRSSTDVPRRRTKPAGQSEPPFHHVVIAVRSAYAAVNYRRPGFSSRCSPCLELSAAGRHVCTVSFHLPKPSEDSPLQPLLSSCQAREVISSLRPFLFLLLLLSLNTPLDEVTPTGTSVRRQDDISSYLSVVGRGRPIKAGRHQRQSPRRSPHSSLSPIHTTLMRFPFVLSIRSGEAQATPGNILAKRTDLTSRDENNNSSAVAEMGDRLATTDMDRKVKAAVPPFWGAESPSNTMWPGPRPTCMPGFIMMHPTVWPQYAIVTDREDRTDRQRDRETNNGPIG